MGSRRSEIVNGYTLFSFVYPPSFFFFSFVFLRLVPFVLCLYVALFPLFFFCFFYPSFFYGFPNASLVLRLGYFLFLSFFQLFISSFAIPILVFPSLLIFGASSFFLPETELEIAKMHSPTRERYVQVSPECSFWRDYFGIHFWQDRFGGEHAKKKLKKKKKRSAPSVLLLWKLFSLWREKMYNRNKKRASNHAKEGPGDVPNESLDGYRFVSCTLKKHSDERWIEKRSHNSVVCFLCGYYVCVETVRCTLLFLSVDYSYDLLFTLCLQLAVPMLLCFFISFLFLPPSLSRFLTSI